MYRSLIEGPPIKIKINVGEIVQNISRDCDSVISLLIIGVFKREMIL